MSQYYKRYSYVSVNGINLFDWRQHYIFSFDIDSVYTLLPFSVANWYGDVTKWEEDKKTVRLD